MNSLYVLTEELGAYAILMDAADSADSPILEEAGESGSEKKPKPLVKYGELVILGQTSERPADRDPQLQMRSLSIICGGGDAPCENILPSHASPHPEIHFTSHPFLLRKRIDRLLARVIPLRVALAMNVYQDADAPDNVVGWDSLRDLEIKPILYNGYLPAGERGRRRSKFVLYRRPAANGVRRSKHYVVKTPHSSKAILDASQHSISYTLSRSQAVIVEYTEDPDTDMFQLHISCHVLCPLVRRMRQRACCAVIEAPDVIHCGPHVNKGDV
ncbi:Protein pellino [Papilio xuthus]|uniref:Protein pellino n=1 Tax=Papilio xuthus TaxID=66420 RepID=A0A194PMT6_PAPXU|nr:Protein pellino [Papilio xuthus]